MKRILLAITASIGLYALAAPPDNGKAPFAPAGEGSLLAVPDSTLMLGNLLRHVSAAELTAALPAGKGDPTYGFSTSVSRESGSLKLGMLMADLKVAVAAADSKRVQQTAGSLIGGFQATGAPAGLAIAVSHTADVARSGDFDAVRKAAIPILDQWLEAFVEAEGQLVHYRLGEWTESTLLALTAAETAELPSADLILGGLRTASVFLAEIGKDKAPPEGMAKALGTLAELGAKAELDARDVKTARKALADLAAFGG